jgi:hypothetical protein
MNNGGSKPMTDLKEWLAHMADKRQRLYEQYGKPLEEEHSGEYVAIAFDGQTILAKRSGEVLKRAVERFGSGNFVLARVGHRTFGRWLSITR